MIEAQPEARTGVVPQIVLHGHTPAGVVENEYGRSNIDKATNVTAYATSVSWTHSIRAPYETMQIEMVFPGGVFQSVMPGIKLGHATRAPSTGFWVVLYLPNETTDRPELWSAIHWGYATRLRIRAVADPGTGLQSVQVSVSCESWVGQLQRNSMFVAPGSNYIRRGSSYSLEQWAEEWAALAQGAIGQPPGVTFAKVWPSIAQSLLPDSLLSGLGTYASWSDGVASEPYGTMGSTPDPENQQDGSSVAAKCYTMGQAIKLVHDVDSCAQWAPARALQQKGVGGAGIPSAGSTLPNATTWAFLQSTFFPTPYVECFPSLEWPYGLAGGTVTLERVVASDSSEAAAAYAAMGAETGHYTQLPIADALSGDRGAEVASSWTIDIPSACNGDFSHPDFALGEAFGGACPVLIYRMRPTLFTAINQNVGTRQVRSLLQGEPDEAYYRLIAAPSASERLGTNQATQIIAAAPNISPNLDYVWGADQVHEVQWNYSEDDRVNMLQVKTPWKAQSEFQDHRFSGVPVVNNADVAKHGLRMRTIDWPFLPAQALDGLPGDIGDSMSAMNEELWTTAGCHGHGHFFGTGSVRGVYKPRVKAGHYAAFFWQSGAIENGSTQWAPFVHAPQDDPDATAEDQDFPGFSGYITSVTHSVSAGSDGAIRASTSMQLERVAVAEGATKVAYNYPPPGELIDNKTPIFIDPDTGQVVAGTVTVQEDGTIVFTPAPAAGGG